MSRHLSAFIGGLILVTFVAFGSTSMSGAGSQGQPVLADSPYDLINAVNALRASYGRAPYSINSILMYTAQAQADFLAATGSMTHSGPGGISVTDRLLVAGYPLAGDLSLGGFRSENITGGSESMSAQAAVNAWTGDTLHLTTMISPSLTEIGAGVAVSNGRVYYVIDCALPTTSAPQVAETSTGSGSAVPDVPSEVTVIVPVTLSTPDAEESVIHEVLPGQTLWQIAVAYEVKIDEIKGLNNLSDNNIYPGDKLFIKRGAVLSTPTPTETLSEVAAPTLTSLPTATFVTAQAISSMVTPVVLVPSTPPDNSMIMKLVMGVIALGLLGGGIFAWLGDSKKEQARRSAQNRGRNSQ
jgi:uncharacterized protein YkwD